MDKAYKSPFTSEKTKHELIVDFKRHREYEEFWWNYHTLYGKYKHLLDRPRIEKPERDPSAKRDYLYDLSYGVVRKSALERSLLQVDSWDRAGDAIGFQTLTVRSGDLRSSCIEHELKHYRRRLRESTKHYLSVWEKGATGGRLHFHTLFGYNGRHVEGYPVIPWELGIQKTVRVKYLGDGRTSSRECILNGWTKDKVAGYMCKYIQKQIDDPPLSDFYIRNSCSRNYGKEDLLWKIKKATTQQLENLVKTGTTMYMSVVIAEARMELARRYHPTIQSLRTETLSPEACAVRSLISPRVPVPSGTSRKADLRTKYNGWEIYEKDRYGTY
jgi:hypothetical protein